MNEDLNNTASAPADKTPEKETSASSYRVRRMRSWLGTNCTGPSHGHAVDNEPLLPGEGHSGWNR